MNTILECKDLIKKYKKITAVDQVNLKLKENKIYGLLGRNGAGKTTLLNLIYGNIFKDKGEIKVFGNVLNKGDTPEGVCYVKEEASFFESARVEEILNLASHFHENWDDKMAGDLIKTFELDSHKKYMKLSRGMKSMVNIIIGMASRAPLRLFDEPALGLDAVMREKFYSIMLEDYNKNPGTILISTHLIDEVASVLEYVYIIDNGRIVLENEIDQIRGKALVLSGEKKAVDRICEEKNIIHRETHASINIAAIYDKLTKGERKAAEKINVNIEGISLQKFFAYYVSKINDGEEMVI